jgi:hypothetical protein
MVPGVIKDLDPRLLKASEMLLLELRERIAVSPGPYESGRPRGYLAITNSMQVPYLCQAGIKLLVAANVITPEGPARLSQRESGVLYLLHPGFMFRDNVISGAINRRTSTASDWVKFFDGMSSRVHAEIGKGNDIWYVVNSEAKLEPSGECPNGHPIAELALPCEVCGERAIARSPVAILLSKPLGMLELSDAIKARLIAHGFVTVGDLFEASESQIDEVEYIGEVRTSIIKSVVSSAVDEFVAG